MQRTFASDCAKSSNKELVEHFTRALQLAGLELAPDHQYGVSYEAFGGPQRLAAVARLKSDPSTVLAIECKRDPMPRDMGSALWQLDEYARHVASSGNRIVRVLLAERLSQGARDALRHRGVAFCDSSGTLFFRHGQVNIDIDLKEPSEARARLNSIFVGAREQVVHALLHRTDRWFTGLELARTAETSSYTVSQVLGVLEMQGWIEGKSVGRNAQRRLTAPGALLDAWAGSWRARQETHSSWFATVDMPGALAASVGFRLQRAGMSDCARTGLEASTSILGTPPSWEQLRIIVPGGVGPLYATAARLRPAAHEANVRLVERTRASLLFRRPGSPQEMPFASPFIVYLDLLTGEEEGGDEVAHELRRRILSM